MCFGTTDLNLPLFLLVLRLQFLRRIFYANQKSGDFRSRKHTRFLWNPPLYHFNTLTIIYIQNSIPAQIQSWRGTKGIRHLADPHSKNRMGPQRSVAGINLALAPMHAIMSSSLTQVLQLLIMSPARVSEPRSRIKSSFHWELQQYTH